MSGQTGGHEKTSARSSRKIIGAVSRGRAHKGEPMDFIKKALQFVKKKLGKEATGLGFLALHIVQKIQTEMPNATAKEKRDKAIEEVMAAAKSAGIEAGENAVRFLIESAVAVVKEKLNVAAPAPAPSPAKAPASKKK